MSQAPSSASTRVLGEMMEMAQALQGHALISKQDMAKMQLICQKPPAYTPENVTYIRVERAKVSQSAVQKWESPGSGRHPSGAAAKLLQLIEARGLEAIVA